MINVQNWNGIDVMASSRKRKSSIWLIGFMIVALMSVCVPQVAGKITTAAVRSDDRLLIPLDQPFGFSKDGRINVTISNFALRSLYDPASKRISSDPDLNGMGLMLTTTYGALLMDEEASDRGLCPLYVLFSIAYFIFPMYGEVYEICVTSNSRMCLETSNRLL